MQFRDFREIVIIPANQNELLVRQHQLLNADSAGIKDRQIKISVCSDAGKCDWRSDSNIKAIKEFTVVLLGKDGGMKQTWHRLVTTREIFGVIDAMPMRKSEMRKPND